MLSVAEDRWPHVNFKVINTAVQGAPAVPEVITALEALDADPEVDVIIMPAAAVRWRICCRFPRKRCNARSHAPAPRWYQRLGTSRITRCWTM